jgi:hypothetical protein
MDRIVGIKSCESCQKPAVTGSALQLLRLDFIEIELLMILA